MQTIYKLFVVSVFFLIGGVFTFGDANADLRQGVRSGDAKIVKQALDAGASLKDINFDEIYETGLENYEDLVKMLVANGVEPTKLLLWTVRNGSESVLEFLLEKGADLNRYGSLLFYNAHGEPRVIKSLVKAGVEPSDFTVVNALTSGNLELAQFIVDRGFDLNNLDPYSAGNIGREGDSAAIEFFLEHGGNIDRVLEGVADSGNMEMVQYLLGRGANPKANNSSAVRAAASKNHKDIVDLLLKEGADLNEALAGAVGRVHLEFVKYLVELGADVKAIDGKALVNIGSMNGDYFNQEKTETFSNYDAEVLGKVKELIKYLLELGADTSKLLEGAVIANSMAMVDYLVELGAEPKFESVDVLVYPLSAGNVEMVKFILNAGVSLSDNRRGVLEAAVGGLSKEVVEFLIELDSSIVNSEDACHVVALGAIPNDPENRATGTFSHGVNEEATHDNPREEIERLLIDRDKLRNEHPERLKQLEVQEILYSAEHEKVKQAFRDYPELKDA